MDDTTELLLSIAEKNSGFPRVRNILCKVHCRGLVLVFLLHSVPEVYHQVSQYQRPAWYGMGSIFTDPHGSRL